MSLLPVNMGERVLEITHYVSPSSGLLPFRIVVIDESVTTTNYGTANYGPIKNPTIALVNGEDVIGVVVGPASYDYTNSSYTEYSPILRYIPQNYPANVRYLGIAPILTDTTTGSTNIQAGQYVAGSATSGQGGTIAQATRSSNGFSTGQHIVGIAITSVTANSLYCLVKIQPQEV